MVVVVVSPWKGVVASLGSNILALNAQRHLGVATEAVGSSYERLSTGQRINKASDDAAGLAIADSLRGSSRILTTARRNINDGLSTLNIMDGALANQSDIIQRLVELAEQSANGTYSDTQRAALNNEHQKLIDEFGRLGESTKFNGQSLLLGGRGANLSSILLQAGIDGSVNSLLSMTTADTGSMSGVVNYSTMMSSLSGSYFTLDEMSQATNGYLWKATLTDSAGTNHDIYLSLAQGTSSSANIKVFVRAEEYTGSTSADAGKYRALTTFAFSYLSFDPATGQYLSTTGGQHAGLSNGAFINAASFSSADFRGLKLSSNNGLNGPMLGGETSLDFTGVESRAHALSSLDTLRRRLDSLANIRGNIGAIQSRLSIASELTATTNENYTAAESRIRDVDVASEAASLISSQIKQQTAAQMLQIASQQPTLLLSLLQQ